MYLIKFGSLICFLFFANYLFAQHELWKDTLEVTVTEAYSDEVTERTLYRTFTTRREEFAAFGTSLPLLNWALGFPYTRMEWSNYFMKYYASGWNWQFNLQTSLIDYDLNQIEVLSYVGPTNFELTFCKLKAPKFVKTIQPKKQIVAGDTYKSYVYEGIIPIRSQKGINFGYAVSWELGIDNRPYLTHGPVIGFQSRKFMSIVSKISSKGNDDFTSKKTWNFDRVFYFNLVSSVQVWGEHVYTYGGLGYTSANKARIPFGLHAGWYFLSPNKLRLMWNVELGIRGPLFLETFTKYPAIPSVYFAFRMFFSKIWNR